MNRIALVILCLLFLATASFAYYTGLNGASYCGNPPFNRTCITCHSGNPLNSTLGSLTLTGFPSGGYTPGSMYTLTLHLSQPSMRRWGFQLTSVKQSNSTLRGGQITNTSTNTSLTNGTGNNPDYLNMSIAGNYQGTVNGPVTWQFNWTAPLTGTGMILFYSSAAACNNDNTTTGDYVYSHIDSLSEATTGPQSPNAFSLLSPPNGVIVLPPVVTLRWTAAIDPNPTDTVRYFVFISTDTSFITPDSFSSGTADTLRLTGLSSNVTYFWKVRASDQTGLCRWSTEIFHFRMASGNPPTTPVLASPPNGGTVVPDTVRLVWSGGIDPDSSDVVTFLLCFLCAGDSVSYPIGSVNNILIRIDTIRVFRSGYHTQWWVIAMSNIPTASVSSNRFAFMHTQTSVSESASLPASCFLSDPYPNPFNASIRFTLTIPYAMNARGVLYNSDGQQVGYYEWGLMTGTNSLTIHPDLPSGSYWLRCIASGVSTTKKITLLR